MNTASLLRAGLSPGPLVGALAVAGLLAVFAGVVREAVHRADAGRRVNALLAEAHWRCKALKLPRQRDDCLRLVQDAPPGDSAALQSLVAAAAAMPTAFGAAR